jgi:hypothetical protein
MFRKFGWETLVPAAFNDFTTWWLRMRRRVPKPCRRAYDSMVLLVARGIWLHRNNMIFNDVSLLPSVVAHMLSLLLDDWCSVKLVDRSSLYRE